MGCIFALNQSLRLDSQLSYFGICDHLLAESLPNCLNRDLVAWYHMGKQSTYSCNINGYLVYWESKCSLSLTSCPI